MTLKRFCNEKKMEEMIATSQPDHVGHLSVSPAQGIALAALVRRITGHNAVAQSLASLLEPLGLHNDIAFSSEQTMASVVRQPIDGLPLHDIFEHVEKERHRLEG